MLKMANYRHPGNHWWRRLNMIGCDHIPFLLLLGAVAYKKFNLLITGTVGTSKTTFWENLSRALGKKYKTFDCDKLSTEYLQGDLNSEYLFKVPNAIASFSEIMMKSLQTLINTMIGKTTKTNPVHITLPPINKDTRLYVNGVDDYAGGFLIFDEVKRADPRQQALVLNLMSNRTFDGKYIDSFIVACTNTKYAELHDFSEALLSRMNLVIQFPSLKNMSSEEKRNLIQSTAIEGDAVAFQPELLEKFNLLVNELTNAFSTEESVTTVDTKLLEEIRKFVQYLVLPLIQVFPNAEDKISARYVKNAVRIFYIYFKTLEIVEDKTFDSLTREELRNAYFSIFPYTMYLEDLEEAQLTQIHNACFLAFTNAYDKSKITLHDIIKLLPEQSAIYLIWHKFLSEMQATKPEERDLIGVMAFLSRVEDYCKGNVPVQYMLYKRLLHDLNRFNVQIEKDALQTFEKILSKHQETVDAFIATSTNSIELSAEKLDAGFIEKILLVSSEKVVSSLTYDKNLYETLLTILMALEPDLLTTNTLFIQRCYDDLIQIMQVGQ